MRFLSKLALVAMLALGVAASGHAQGLVNPLLPVKGTREISFRGNLNFEPEDDYNISASYGPFLDDGRLQVGGEFSYSGGDNFDFTTIGAFVNYHFPGASPTLPFVGLFLGITTGEGDDLTSYGAQAGVKHFLNSSVAFTAALEYRDFDDAAIDNQVGINFGLAIFLR